MKHCTICQKELPTSLDEYGLVQAPLCRDCHFECGPKIETLLQDWFYPHHLSAVFQYAADNYDSDLEMLLVDLETHEISPGAIIK